MPLIVFCLRLGLTLTSEYQNDSGLRFSWRKRIHSPMLGNHPPNDSQLDPAPFMGESIAQGDDSPPEDFGVHLPQGIGDSLGGLPDDHQGEMR